MFFFQSVFSSNDAMRMSFHGPFSYHTPDGEEDNTSVFTRGMLALHKVAVVRHVLPVFPMHGLLPAHHLLSAFPAIKLETAGKWPLVQIQSFPPNCCVASKYCFTG